MKLSFIEDFFIKLRQDKKRRYIFTSIIMMLAVFVFFFTYILISPDAITIESDEISTYNDSAEIFDFTDCIYSVSVKKEQDGKYIDFTEFYDGDTVQVQLVYSMAYGTLAQGQNVICYQLPVGIYLEAELSGDVVVSGDCVGEYVIDVNGMIYITFTSSDFDYTNAFVGTVTFEGEVDASALEEGKEIVFNSDNSFSIVQEDIPVSYDISGSKSQTSSDDGSCTYEIVINSTQGSGETISVYDAFITYAQGYENAQYDTRSFSITKTSSDGSQTSVDSSEYSLYLNNNSNTSSFSIGDLAALQANESYVISYTVTPSGASSSTSNGETTLNNKVTVSSGDNSFSDTTSNIVTQGEEEPTTEATTEPTTEPEPEPTSDISGSKTQVSNSDGVYTYQVVVSSTLGSGSEILLFDSFSTSSVGTQDADYDYDSFEILLTNSLTGETQIIDASSYLSIDNSSSPSSFTLELDALEENSSYTITYSASVSGSQTPSTDGTSSIINTLTVTTDEESFSTTTTDQVYDTVLVKSGNYDSTTGIATWTIDINPGEFSLAGYTLSDEIYSDDGDSVIVTSAQLTDLTTGEVTDIDLPYTFSDDFDNTHSYQLTYTTDVLDIIAANKYVTVSNIVTLDSPDNYDDDDESNDYPDYTSDITLAKIYNTNYELDKVSTAADGETGVYSWEVSIVIPEDEKDVSSDLVYYDDIETLVFDGHIDKSHYTTVAALKAIKICVDGQIVNPEYYSITYTNFNYQVYTGLNEADSTGIRIFNITFKTEFLLQNLGSEITIEYDTYVDIDLATDGSEYIVRNIASVGTESVSADVDYRKGKGITKFVSTNGNTYYESLSEPVEYSDIYDEDLNATVLSYKITFTSSMYEDIPEYMQDILPEGAEFIESSFYVEFKITEYWSSYDPWINGKQYFASDYITYEIKDGIVQFNISDQYSEIRQAFINSGYLGDFYIYYSIALPSSSTWDNYAQTDFVNSLICGPDTVSNSVSVQNSDGYLTKSGEQDVKLDDDGNAVVGSDGQYTYENSATYTLEVNKANAKLSVSDTQIQVIDTMSLADTAGSYASLDRSSFKVYYYDDTANDNKGELLDVDDYAYVTSSVSTSTGYDYIITINLPDEQAFILEYTYNIYYQDSAVSDLLLTNEAVVNGLDETKQASDINMKRLSSSATVIQKSLTIYKYEEGKENMALAGATFVFEKYIDGQWVDTLIGTQTTDEDGLMYFELYDMYFETIYDENVVYRMTETVAPEGYSLLENPVYFVWVAEGGTVSESIEKLELPDGVTVNEITFITEDETTILISNEKNFLTIEKMWISDSYSEIIPTVDSIQVTLYQQTSELSNSHTVTVNSIANGIQEDGSTELEISKEIIVDDQSSLTISVFDTTDIAQLFYVNGSAGAWGTVDSDSANVSSYYIENITSDMSITIMSAVNNGKTYEFYFFDYTEPEYVAIGEKVEYATFTLTKEDDWQMIFSLVDSISDFYTQLPKTDPETGALYFYSVKETSELSGFTATYSDTNSYGVHLGEIVITNQMIGYELPSTGSIGALMYKVIGIILIILSITIILYKKFKERGWNKRLNWRLLN